MSVQKDKISISITADRHDFTKCGELMAATDPWLSLGMDLGICLSAFEGNHRAKKLYESLGYKLVGELENFLSEGFTELIMRKTVGPRLGYMPVKNH